MRSRKPGIVTDRLWYLGLEESGVYFLRGDRGSALINGGMSYILPSVLDQMRDFGIGPEEITNLVILHSHFDHVGIAPYFKRKYPRIELTASHKAVEIFQNPKAVEFINSYNRLSAGTRSDKLAEFDLEWRGDLEVRGVGEGDIMDLGGIGLTFYETPGHSNCSIAAYEPATGALFASDAVGIPFAERLFPSMNTNIDEFLQSLRKLKSLEVSIVCADHYGYITGDEARTILTETIDEGLKWRNRLKDCLLKNQGDLDAAAREITASLYEEMPDYFISAEILQGVFRQTLKYIAKTSTAK
jgi:glyoxylase-like metal-dependent hydrolase (beta-lactamase superfamily II)